MASFDDIKKLCKEYKVKIIRGASPDFAEDSLAAYSDTKKLYIPDNWYDVDADDDLFEILRFIGWIIVDADTEYDREREGTCWAIRQGFFLGLKISNKAQKKAQKELDEYNEGYEYSFFLVAAPRKFSYICSYCQYYTIGHLRRKQKHTWMRDMEEQFQYVSPYELDERQIKAWDDSFDTLKENLKYLPAQYNDIHAVFEYVMPRFSPDSEKGQEEETGIRADVVLVSKNKTISIEFKQRKDVFEGFMEQALKYKRRLDNYHLKAQNMKNKAILVLTKASDYFKRHDDLIVCSRDRLDEAIIALMGKRVYENPDIEEWIDSFDY